MVGTTPAGLERAVRKLVRKDEIGRGPLGELIVVHDLTDAERDRLRVFVRGLGVRLVGPKYF